MEKVDQIRHLSAELNIIRHRDVVKGKEHIVYETDFHASSVRDRGQVNDNEFQRRYEHVDRGVIGRDIQEQLDVVLLLLQTVWQLKADFGNWRRWAGLRHIVAKLPAVCPWRAVDQARC